MELTELSGIGPVRAETLRAMGIFSLRDLLYTLPVRYEDHDTVSPCSTKNEGFILVNGRLVQDPKLSVFHGLKKVTATVEDETGKMPVCWYNKRPDNPFIRPIVCPEQPPCAPEPEDCTAR